MELKGAEECFTLIKEKATPFGNVSDSVGVSEFRSKIPWHETAITIALADICKSKTRQ